jgi:transposase
MTKDEELERLRQENAALREELAQLKEQLQTLQEQHVKDSHHSSLPPSSDRFVQRAKSLREKSGKKLGGQQGHRGHHLKQVATPGEIVLHRVEHGVHCLSDMQDVPASLPERRQVFDLPAKRLWVVEHQVEEKTAPGDERAGTNRQGARGNQAGCAFPPELERGI